MTLILMICDDSKIPMSLRPYDRNDPDDRSGCGGMVKQV